MKKSIFSLVLLVVISILPISLSAAGKDLKRMNPMEMQKVVEKELFQNLHLTANQRGLINAVPNPFIAAVCPPQPRAGYGYNVGFGPKPAPVMSYNEYNKMKGRYLDKVERILTVKQYKQLLKNISSFEKRYSIVPQKPQPQKGPSKVPPARPQGRR